MNQTIKVQAKSVHEALAAVKKRLGPDAIILGTQEMGQGGVLVTAARPATGPGATDADRTRADAAGAADPAGAGAALRAAARRACRDVTDGLREPEPWTPPTVSRTSAPSAGVTRPVPVGPTIAATTGTPATIRGAAGSLDALLKRELRERDTSVPDNQELKALGRAVEEIRSLIAPIVDAEHHSARSGLSAPRARLALQLMNLGVAEHVADSLLRGDDPTADLSTLVASAVRCHGPILRDRAAGGVPVHVVVGPTGVGKTTLIAKLAAEAVLERREHVALITIDTYRVNAVEHLRRYADILDVPFEVAATPTALREALLRHQDRDHVLVDTDGRGPRDAPRLDELGHFVRTGGPMEVHLVLSATTSGTEMLAAARAFASTRPASTVFTKLDEASRLGEILNYLAASHAAVSLLGHGPRTPGNLEVATPERLTRLILQLDPVPPAEVPATGASR